MKEYIIEKEIVRFFSVVEYSDGGIRTWDLRHTLPKELELGKTYKAIGGKTYTEKWYAIVITNGIPEIRKVTQTGGK